jgi:integrase
MSDPKLVLRSKNFAVEYFDQTKGFTTRSSLGTDDPGVARQLYAEWCLKNVATKSASINTVYVEGLMGQFYVQEAQFFPSKYSYKSTLAYCSHYLAGVTLEAFDKKKQEWFVESLRKDGLSDGTIGRMMGAIGRAVQRAYEYREIAEKPFILAVQAHNPRDRILTDTEAKELLQCAKTINEKRYLLLAFTTAARPQAIIDLTKSQFDLKRKLLDLNPPGRKQNPKKYRPVVPICSALLSYCQGFSDGALFVFQKDQRKMGSSRSIAESLEPNFPEDVTLYTIRHTIATELRSQGVPEFEVSAFLGHKPPGVSRVTLDYAKYRPEFMRKAADAIDKYWERIGDGFQIGSGNAGTDGAGTQGS